MKMKTYLNKPLYEAQCCIGVAQKMESQAQEWILTNHENRLLTTTATTTKTTITGKRVKVRYDARTYISTVFLVRPSKFMESYTLFYKHQSFSSGRQRCLTNSSKINAQMVLNRCFFRAYESCWLSWMIFESN